VTTYTHIKQVGYIAKAIYNIIIGLVSIITLCALLSMLAFIASIPILYITDVLKESNMINGGGQQLDIGILIPMSLCSLSAIFFAYLILRDYGLLPNRWWNPRAPLKKWVNEKVQNDIAKYR
jgi:hypothetical protein